ncbi:cyclopropane-fatty-acyl-phospholipid synthase [Jannaschia pagri]|uniref:Cyclopropane-fatty-acyl-phospholipid synthase n=1 Tax=Jannaschia pagri TaxID=2829797 RepID=A0ABQ4NND2_9RHOB|nr:MULTISPECIES: cyclopropane-fatty-acyl-phospholipid synthase family protein [unclassified Jannaschia]GIT91910.1 cyclopropane-fatty-acyl-phospholipid synthase [Jannaschia sp. AI_61]GIT95744.1 cyclopropane-fatty-acyl-phospholipid synthase [Jannaschia sp. AI_62]
MDVITTPHGQANLPRYFGAAWQMLEQIRSGRMDVVLPDGRRFRHEGPEPGPVGEITVHDPNVFARLIREGDLGFTDAYLEGQWSTPDLMALFDLINKEGDSLIQQQPGLAFLRACEKLRFWLQRNTKAQAKKNISAHYDLGNDFYGLWLDDTMTYSAGIFDTGQESLETAQMSKYASIVDRMDVAPGDHVLEIGCGWGGFAEYAAKERGLRVTCLTLSREQLKFAQDRIDRLGLSDRVDFKLQDYRDERGTYDGIASIEMFEAVGQRYWPSYFNTLRDRLRPGRQASLQIITVPDRRWQVYIGSIDFIQKYIFPGGFLPAPFRLSEEIQRAGLEEGSSISIAKGYSLTLRRWFDRFNDQWDEVAALGFDDRFRRMWNTYLTSCAGAFEYGNCDVIQMIVRKPA